MLRCFTLVVAFLINAGAAAQVLRLGARGGPNFSDVALVNYINPDTESFYKMKVGGHLGLSGASSLNERFSLVTEVLYSNKGANAGERIDLHYVTLPLLIRYALTDVWSADIGPEFSYLVLARSAGSNVGNTWNNKLDIGLIAGIGARLTQRLTAGFRFNAGFSSVIDTNAGNSTTGDPLKYQNRVLQISLLMDIADLE